VVFRVFRNAVLICAPVLAWGQNSRSDLNGIWQANNTANWDLEEHSSAPGLFSALGAQGAVPPGLSVVEGGDIPYLPAALVRRKQNYANRLTGDPEIKCYLPGIPRANYMPQPFQIIQSADTVMMLYQYAGAVRTIPMKDPGPNLASSWMGWPAGRWEGNTLVVDSTGFNDKTWFDRSGNFHSDQLHVVERYSPRSADTMMYEATIEDPKVFSRAWKISMPLYRRVEKNAQLLEFRCVEYSEDMLYGDLRKKVTK
jgi:hypothetical protein